MATPSYTEDALVDVEVGCIYNHARRGILGLAASSYVTLARVAPDAIWFANTLIRMLSVCSDNEESNLITDEEMNRVMRYIGQGINNSGVQAGERLLANGL